MELRRDASAFVFSLRDGWGFDFGGEMWFPEN